MSKFELGLPSRHDHADARLFEHVRAHAADERRRRVDDPARSERVLVGFLAHGQRADVEAADAAADPGADVERHGLAGRADT